MPRSTYASEYAEFLRVLRESREGAGVTQQDLAKRLHMTQSAVSKCERGDRRLDVIELRSWCAELGLSLAEFAAELDKALARPSGPRRR